MAIYVFDDMDPEEANYLGVAYVPLIPLAHDKAITGSFELRRVLIKTLYSYLYTCAILYYLIFARSLHSLLIHCFTFQRDGVLNGAVEVNLQWQFTYIPPRVGTRIPTQLLPPGATAAGEPSVALMPDEALPPPPAPTSGLVPRQPTIAAVPSHLALSAARGPTRKLADRSTRRPADAGPPPGQPLSTQAPQQQFPIPAAAAAARVQSPPPTAPQSQTFAPSPSPPASPSPPPVQMAAPPTATAAPLTPAKAAPLASSTPTATPVKLLPTPTPTPSQAAPQHQQQQQRQPSPPPMAATASAEPPRPAEPRSMSDTEDIVVAPRSAASGGPSQAAAAAAAAAPSVAPEEMGDLVSIELHTLALADDSPVFANEQAKKLFVEYKFLNISTDELELPFTLPKPTESGKELPLNWKKGTMRIM